MPWYVVNGMTVHLNVGRRAAPAQCVARVERDGRAAKCCGISAYLCDWPAEGSGTCDAPLCGEHAHQVAKDRHYCPTHLAAQRAAAPELF